MSHTWITVKNTGSGMLGPGHLEETVWNIKHNGEYSVIDKYMMSGTESCNGQLNSSQLIQLEKIIDQIRTWKPDMESEEFWSAQMVCDGDVWSLSVRSGKKSFKYKDLYTYDLPIFHPLQLFLEKLNQPRPRSDVSIHRRNLIKSCFFSICF